MGVDWSERKEAVVAVGLALYAAGWKLYGWKEDRSDSMTDYFDPESWDGIAERDGYIACVDVSDHEVRHSSGGVDKMRPTRGEDCSRCEGSGKDPSGWTYASARKDPRRYNAEKGTVGFPDVVSPLPFDDDGVLMCRDCNGRGYRFGKPEHYVEYRPLFQANPKNCTWHVEYGGEIIAKGRGVIKAGMAGGEKLEKLVSRINAAKATEVA